MIKCRGRDGFKKLFSTSSRGRQVQGQAILDAGIGTVIVIFSAECMVPFLGSWIGGKRLYCFDVLTKCLQMNGLLCFITLEMRTSTNELGEHIQSLIVLK